MQLEFAPSGRWTIDVDDALCHRWRNHHDIQAAQLLVEHYRHLIVDIAAFHDARDLPSEVLLGEGYVGLMHAICRFDPDGGILFSTYAISWISAAIQEHLLHEARRAGRDHAGKAASAADRYLEGVPGGDS